MDYYPRNTLTSFRTHFESPLLLTEDHEAALSEIILPTEWSNVRDDDLIMIVPLRTKNSLAEARRVFNEKRNTKKTPEVDWNTVDRVMNLQKIVKSVNPLTPEEENFVERTTPEMLEKDLEAQLSKPGRRKNKSKYVKLSLDNELMKRHLSTSWKRRKLRSLAQDMILDMERETRVRTLLPNMFPVPPIFTEDNALFVARLNDLLSNNLGGHNFLKQAKQVFSYDPMTRRVTITVPRHTCVLLTEHLSHILGFGVKTHFVTSTTGVYIMDPFGDVYSVYVYTDAIQERRVGDMHVPLLRCVAVDRSGHRKGGIQAISFPHLDYFPLKSKRLDDVGIYLRDRTGQPIPFMRGEVTVTLHLRPVQR